METLLVCAPAAHGDSAHISLKKYQNTRHDPFGGNICMPATDGRTKSPDRWARQARRDVHDRALLWRAAESGKTKPSTGP